MKEKYLLLSANYTGGTTAIPTATIEISIDGKVIRKAAVGKGPVDVVFTAIKEASGDNCTLEIYDVSGVSRGSDSEARVNVVLKCGNINAIGMGRHVDTVVASAFAYIDALNDLNRIITGKAKPESEEPAYPIGPDGNISLNT